MATFNFLNNSIGQLFDVLEGHAGVSFATFNLNESDKVEQGFDGEEKIFMKQYAETHDEPVYKYLYDPDLSFDENFHQRIASIAFRDRNEPWVSVMFNTGTVQSLTDVVSTNQYRTIHNSDGDYFDIKTKRVKVPVNMVLISNDISTLYKVTENLTLFFDRLINFNYCEYVKFPTGTEDEYEKTGQATDIEEVNLTKLDTNTRGSLVTSAYTFGLVYWVTRYPDKVELLERIILDIAIKNHGTVASLIIK